MTITEVNTYIELNKLFQETCDHIAGIFSEYSSDFSERIDNWQIIDNEVFGTNRYIHGYYNDDDRVEVNFGARCLSVSNEELRSIGNE